MDESDNNFKKPNGVVIGNGNYAIWSDGVLTWQGSAVEAVEELKRRMTPWPNELAVMNDIERQMDFASSSELIGWLRFCLGALRKQYHEIQQARNDLFDVTAQRDELADALRELHDFADIPTRAHPDWLRAHAAFGNADALLDKLGK